MKKLLLALLFGLLPHVLSAQGGNTLTLQGPGAPTGNCVFLMVWVETGTGDYYFCNPPTWTKLTGGGSGSPGGTSGQIQYNNSGAFGGFTMAGDATVSVPNITVTKTNGVSFAPSATIDTTNAANVSSGTLPAGRLPNPSATTLGGIESLAAVSHEWINTISTSGVPAATQPACGDLSDSSGGCSMSTTAGGDLSGTLPNPTVAKVDGVAYPASPSTHQVPVVTATNQATYKTVPDCTDTGGNHLNYTQSSDAFSCGTTGSGSPVGTIFASSEYCGGVTNSAPYYCPLGPAVNANGGTTEGQQALILPVAATLQNFCFSMKYTYPNGSAGTLTVALLVGTAPTGKTSRISTSGTSFIAGTVYCASGTWSNNANDFIEVKVTDTGSGSDYIGHISLQFK